jgi:xanthine dioxygenase
MAIELVSLPLPASADASKFTDFGKEVKGVDPGNLTPEQFAVIHDALYKVRQLGLSQMTIADKIYFK